MDEVSMHDGLDAPETIVFGLGAAETAVVVLSLLGAYALTAVLPGAAAWPLAFVVAVTAAALAWVRVQDRSLLGWAALLARFGWHHRSSAVAAVSALRSLGGDRCRVAGRRWASRLHRPRPGVQAWEARRPGSPPPGVDPVGGGDTVVIRLLPSRPGQTSGRGDRGPRRVAVTALRGGSGRTTVACEVAALVAAGAGAATPQRTVLVDAAARLPTASLRLGIPLTTAELGGARRRTETGPLVRHACGLWVLPGPARARAREQREAALAEALDTAERHRPDLVMLAGCDLDDSILDRCDDIIVLLSSSETGILDGYWSTAMLRARGLRDRLIYVANRCAAASDLTDFERDLGIRVAVRVPDDPSLGMTGGGGIVPSLDLGGVSAAALAELAVQVTSAPDAAEAAWGGRAG